MASCPQSPQPNVIVLSSQALVLGVNLANNNTAPAITQAPQDANVVEGATATFSVAASGNAIAYQWQRSNDGGNSYANVPGATVASVSVVTTLADHNSLWRVVLSNAGGSTTSTPARLSVSQQVIAPAITSDPAHQTVVEGETASFTVAGSGAPAPTTQWQTRSAADAASGNTQQGWADVPGATAATYTTATTTLAQSGVQYRAVLQNSAGSATSLAATLTVNAAVVAPAITTQPQPQTVQVGNAGLFSVAASGTSPLSYQWFKNGVAIVGANATEVLVPALAEEVGTIVQITVQVSNPAGSVTSAAASMSVTAAPVAGTDVGTAGGTLTLGAAETDPVLTIPAGALASTTRVIFNREAGSATGLPAGVIPVGDVLNIGPSNLVFAPGNQAVLSLPVPETLPDGMALGLATFEPDTALQKTRLGAASKRRVADASAAPTATNLHRLAATYQGKDGVRAMASKDFVQAACNSIQNYSGGRAVTLIAGVTRVMQVAVPANQCSFLPSPPAPENGVPSSTTEACAMDADYPNSNSADAVLVNRHVVCARSSGSTVVDRWNAGLLDVQNVGDVEIQARIAMHGKSSAGLQKSVKLKLGYLYQPRGNNFPAPTLNLRALFFCSDIRGVTLACNGQTPTINLSPGSQATELDHTLTFNWPNQGTNPIAETGVSVRLLFTVDGSTPANEPGNRTYSIDLGFASPALRCDVGRAKATTSGCVFPEAAAVFSLLSTDPQTQSRRHIRDAFAGVNVGLTDVPDGVSLTVPGRFVLKSGTRAIAENVTSPLRRTRDPAAINASRAESNRRCKRLFGPAPAPVPEVCEVVIDPDNVPGPCDCDEYPFASSRQGAMIYGTAIARSANEYSVRRISSSDNRSAGAKLGATYTSERVLDDEEFWVAVPD